MIKSGDTATNISLDELSKSNCFPSSCLCDLVVFFSNCHSKILIIVPNCYLAGEGLFWVDLSSAKQSLRITLCTSTSRFSSLPCMIVDGTSTSKIFFLAFPFLYQIILVEVKILAWQLIVCFSVPYCVGGEILWI